MQQQQQSPASQPSQRPPLHQGQPQPRPMGFRPQQQPGAPVGYRPPMHPGLPRPGFQPSNSSISSPQPGLPAGVRPGFNPNQQRPMMRPVGQSPMQSPATRPVVPLSPGAAASPIQQHQEPPMSPTTQNPSAEHHRRKRMYPEQITKAYAGDVPASPGYPPQQQQQQQQQSYGSPAMANQQVQSQFISPMGTPAATTSYTQPQPQPQPQQQQPGYNAYGQDPLNQMTSQFGNMNMNAAPSVRHLGFYFFIYMILIY